MKKTFLLFYFVIRSLSDKQYKFKNIFNGPLYKTVENIYINYAINKFLWRVSNYELIDIKNKV